MFYGIANNHWGGGLGFDDDRKINTNKIFETKGGRWRGNWSFSVIRFGRRINIEENTFLYTLYTFPYFPLIKLKHRWGKKSF
jgi:hypothetical protein